MVVGDLTAEGLFVSMGGLFDLDMRLVATTTDMLIVVVPYADEPQCKDVQQRLMAEGVQRVGDLRFVGAKTIWDAVDVAFPLAKRPSVKDSSPGAPTSTSSNADEAP